MWNPLRSDFKYLPDFGKNVGFRFRIRHTPNRFQMFLLSISSSNNNNITTTHSRHAVTPSIDVKCVLRVLHEPQEHDDEQTLDIYKTIHTTYKYGR